MGRLFRGVTQQTKSSKTFRTFSQQKTTFQKTAESQPKRRLRRLSSFWETQTLQDPTEYQQKHWRHRGNPIPLVWEDPGRGKSTYRLEGGISCQVTKERRHQQLLQLQRNSTSLRAWKGLQQNHSREIKERNGPKTERPASRLSKEQIMRSSQNVGVITALNYSD